MYISSRTVVSSLWFSILDTGYLMLDTGFSILDARCSIRSFRVTGLHYIYRDGKEPFCDKKTKKGLDADCAGYAVFLFSHREHKVHREFLATDGH